MNSLAAYQMALANKGARQMVFDWEKAARLIKERQPSEASAGLRSDWEYTGGVIWRDGEPVKDGYTYLSSNWAVPELDMDGDVVECWRYQDESPEWDESTKWPESALALL